MAGVCLHRDGLHHMQAVSGPRGARGRHAGGHHRGVLQRGGGAAVGRAVRRVVVAVYGADAADAEDAVQRQRGGGGARDVIHRHFVLNGSFF